MDFNELKKALAKEAKEAGICQEWYDYILNASSKERLMALYFGGFDFVEANNYPSEKLIREFADILHHYNVYIREQFNARNPRRLVAYTEATGTAYFTEFSVSQIWLRPGSEMKVKATGHSYITIDVVSGAKASILATEHSKVIVYNHGGTITKEAIDKAVITIKDK